jgi:hypothetical protein
MPPEDLTNLPDGGGAEAPAETSLHEDIARAFEQVETRDAPPGAPASPLAADPVTPAAPPGERVRGPDGRFLPKDETSPPKPPEKPPAAPPPGPAPKPTPSPPPPPGAPQPPLLKAPAAWRPQVREHWSKLPAEVQQEVTRLDRDVQRMMQEDARLKERAGQSENALAYVQQVIAPYAHNIRASGQDALGMLSNFFQADNILRHGSDGEKAQLAANIIEQYGVNVEALDAVLWAKRNGQPMPQGNGGGGNMAHMQEVQRMLDQRLQPIMGYVQQQQQRQQHAYQQIEASAAEEVGGFGQDAQHEFFDDVRLKMADLIDFYTAKGEQITLEQAYDLATKMDPHVSEIIAKRAESERAAAAAQAAQRARRTAVSLSSAPAPAGTPGPGAMDDRRAAIEAAWDDATSR